MGTKYYDADGRIVSGRGIGEYVHCWSDIPPIRLKYYKLIFKTNAIISRPGWYGSDGTYLWYGPEERRRYYERNSNFIFTPQTVARIDVLASTTNGPNASNFVKGTLLAGAAVGAAAAMASMGSKHTVKVTWKDNAGSKESIISFNNGSGFQNFIGQLGSLMNLPNETTPALSSADEILKFKKLMEDGVITQAEFEAKKKQLLGL